MKKVIRLTESDLVRLVKKVIQNEQILGATTRFNLAKGTSKSTGRFPTESGDTPQDDVECNNKNVKSIFVYCKKNKSNSEFKPDLESKKIAENLYKEMKGINFVSTGLYKTLEKIKDYKQFCKVDNSFLYESESLEQWIGDELVHPKTISDSLKRIWRGIGHSDSCKPLQV
jgi:antirestriction protein